MDVYTTEEEQIEAIRKWWRENGKSIIFGIVIGLGAVFGWRTWQEHRITQAEDASALFQNALGALRSDSPDEAEAPATEIVDHYGGTGYAVLARLLLAKLAVDNDDLDKAAEQLQQALKQNGEATLDLAIRLRLARVRLAQQQYDAALSLLDTSDRGEYGPAYDEVRGDILAARGDRQAAMEAYRQAMLASQERSADTSVLEMKMDELGAES